MTRGDRLRWLLDHPQLWEGWPQSRGDYKPGHWECERAIKKAMREAGLYSPRTYVGDINLVNLIKDARALRRETA